MSDAKGEESYDDDVAEDIIPHDASATVANANEQSAPSAKPTKKQPEPKVLRLIQSDDLPPPVAEVPSLLLPPKPKLEPKRKACGGTDYLGGGKVSPARA